MKRITNKSISMESKQKKRKKKTKIKLTPEQKKRIQAERKKKADERRFKTDINTVFKNAGFTQIPTRDKQITFEGKDGEIDSIFVHENIIVISEDTTSNDSKNISDHIRKKAQFFKHIEEKQNRFIPFLDTTFPEFKQYCDKHPHYDVIDYKLKFIYCSKNAFEGVHKHPHSDILFFDYPYLRYFLSLAKTIQKSSKYELFKFLGLNISEIGLKTSAKTIEINGFLLPESPSGFPTNHNIVTFYIDPLTVLQLSYVLRKDGSWRDEEALYQRLIIKSKIKGMREYLSAEKRVFINNIIATLPSRTKILDENGDTVKISQLDKTKATPIKIQVPFEFNAMGIIDGQHRIFAYHEGSDKFESSIASKRAKQNLLITGIIYPQNFEQEKKLKFESKLFLEINDKQSRVKADLKQAIEMLVNPFEAIAISKAIISQMSQSGPLINLLEVHFYDRGKIKTSSIVSYGLRHIVKLSGEDSLFKIWTHPKKANLLDKIDKILLKEYITFCVSELTKMFAGYKKILTDRKLFSLDRKESRALTATAINGVIFCLRKIIEEKSQTKSHEQVIKAFEKLTVDYSPKKFKYKSSHWKELGEKIFLDCFSK
jgi:DGQHR domain-containing protein